jgi:hypothetical protein
MSNKLIYYVYAYLRSKDSKTAKAGSPYYIGKGKVRRAWAPHGKIPVPLDKSNIVFLERNLSDIGACALERRYIKWYGRKDNKTGILLNMTDGGDGSSGHKHSNEWKEKTRLRMVGVPRSEEARKNIGLAKRGLKLTDDHKQKISTSHTGISLSETHCSAISKSLTGIPRTETTKKKISEAKLGKNLSENHCKSIRDGLIGRKLSPEHIANMRKSLGSIGPRGPDSPERKAAAAATRARNKELKKNN